MKIKFSKNPESISSLEEHPANPSPSPVSEKDWMIHVATWPSSFFDLLISKSLDGSSGKMSPVSCQAATDGILVPSSGRFSNSGMGSLTESWTLNTSEFPSVAVESLLSDILETTALPQRFFLSAKACAG